MKGTGSEITKWWRLWTVFKRLYRTVDRPHCEELEMARRDSTVSPGSSTDAHTKATHLRWRVRSAYIRGDESKSTLLHDIGECHVILTVRQCQPASREHKALGPFLWVWICWTTCTSLFAKDKNELEPDKVLWVHWSLSAFVWAAKHGWQSW